MKYICKQKGISLISLIISIAIIIVGIILFVNISNNSKDKISKSDNKSDDNYIQMLHGLNQELDLVGSDGGKASLTITGIREMSERNQFSNKNFSQIFLIDYEYKNISSRDSMYISDMNFTIVDEKGETGGTYPNEYIYPEKIIAGTTCKAQMVFGVKNYSNKIKLQFWGSAWDEQPVAIFEIDV